MYTFTSLFIQSQWAKKMIYDKKKLALLGHMTDTNIVVLLQPLPLSRAVIKKN